MKMPVTRKGLRQYDNMPAIEAVAKAWNVPGRHPRAHEQAKREVKDAMPLLYRALERLIEEQNNA